MSETTQDNGPSNDATQEWLRQLRTQERKCAEENMARASLYRRAKADGLNIKAAKNVIRLKQQDPVIVQQDLRDTLRMMALQRIPVHQDALFDWDQTITQKTQQEDDLWDAQDNGYRMGRHGARIEECKYEPGSELFVAWQEFWQKGQAAIARELGPDSKLASTDRKRPSTRRQTRLPGTEERMEAPPVPGMPKKTRAKKAAGGKTGANGTRKRRSKGPRTAEDGAQVY